MSALPAVPSRELPRYVNDPDHLRDVFASFPTGVVALLAQVDGAPCGMVASAFTVGVSFDPPLVSCAVQRSSATWPLLRAAARVGVSVLAADQGALAHRVASRDRGARFVDVPLRQTGSSALFIAGAPVWFECAVHDELPAGDHVVALLEVVALGADPALAPLVLHERRFAHLQQAARDHHPESAEPPGSAHRPDPARPADPGGPTP